jgi:hypothetical protein
MLRAGCKSRHLPPFPGRLPHLARGSFPEASCLPAAEREASPARFGTPLYGSGEKP